MDLTRKETENGQKKQEEVYIDGKSQRIHRWYSNGQTQSIEIYQDGKIHKYLEWYNDGRKESECTFNKNGKVHGKWLEWYPGGEKKGEGILNHGTGTFVVFYRKGTKKEQREIKDGKMHGRWIWWDISGNVVKEEIYKDNKLVKKIQ